jgi:hypothetical protein
MIRRGPESVSSDPQGKTLARRFADNPAGIWLTALIIDRVYAQSVMFGMTARLVGSTG